MRHTILKKTNYVIEFDYIENEEDGTEFILCHLEVFKWNKTVRKQLLRDVICLARLQELPVFTTWDRKDMKFLKFITMMGFVPSKYEIEDDDEMLFTWSDA